MDFKRLGATILGLADALGPVVQSAGLNSADARNVGGILDTVRKAAGAIGNEKPVVVKQSDVAKVVKGELPAALKAALADPETLALIAAAVAKAPAGDPK